MASAPINIAGGIDTSPGDAAPQCVRLSRWVLAFIAIAGAVAVASRLSHLGRPFLNDAGLYIAMGKTVVDGGQLYVDLWDTKLPSVALLTGVLYAMFGSQWWMYVVLQMLMGVGAAGLLGLTSARLIGAENGRIAGWAAFAYGLVLLNMTQFTSTGFQLETPLAFFACAAAWAWVRGWHDAKSPLAWALLAGVMAGMAGMAKPTGLAVAAAAGLSALIGMRGRGLMTMAQRVAALVAGVTFVVAVNLVFVWQQGIGPELPGVVREIRAYAAGVSWSATLSPKTLVILGLVVWPIGVAGAWWTWKRLPLGSKPGNAAEMSSATKSTTWAWSFALLWLAIELVGVLMQRRVYNYHFLPVLAPAAIVFALVIRHRLNALVLAIAFLPLMALSLHLSRHGVTFLRRGAPVVAAAQYIRANSRPGETVFYDPVGTLSVLADRPAGARLGMLIHFINDDDAPRRFSAQLLEDLDQRQPRFVVMRGPIGMRDRLAQWETQPNLAGNPGRTTGFRQAWADYRAYVEAEYEAVHETGGLVIYERRSTPP